MSDRTNLSRKPGLLGPVLAAFLGAAGLAGTILALGGGFLLALVAYSLGGSVLILAFASAAAFRPATARLRAVSAARMLLVGELRHG